MTRLSRPAFRWTSLDRSRQAHWRFRAGHFFKPETSSVHGNTSRSCTRSTGSENWNAVLLQFGIDGAAGDGADARKLLDRQLERYAEGQYVSAYVVGEGYKALGDYDEAIAWFTRAVEQHHPHALMMMPVFNRNHPVIGKDPRFLTLLKRMGLDGDQSKAAGGP